MGFDLRKTISKFSSRLQKQQKGNKEVLTPTTTREDESQRPGSAAAAKRKVKVPISTFTTSTASHDSNTNSTNNVTSQTIRKNGKAVKVVKFVDCDCSRNIKVSPYYSVPPSETGTTTKSINFSISTPHPSDGRRQLPFERSLSSISSKEDFPAAAPKSPNSSLGCAANEKPAQTRNMLPATEGIHSRNLSYGTIFNASKSASYRELRPCPKDARSNAKATTADVGNVSQRISAKPGRSVPHVFGLGGCSYGHGSIVNGMKSLKNPTTVDFEFSQRKGDVAKRKQGSQPALSYHSSSSSSSQAYSVDELKNMGNEEYTKGQFKNAIYFYDKAIRLMPCNAACHHNKAAALASLGRIREAVVECLEAVSCDPAYSRAHYRLGTLYTKLGHLDNAKKHLRMSGSGHNSEAVQRMLAVEGHMNSMKRAVKILDWERVIIESSKSLKAGAVECDEAFAAKAEALLHLHRPNEALEILKARKSTGDGNSGRTFSHFLRLETQVYLCLGRFEEAVKVAEEALNAEYNTDSLLLLKKAWAAADAHRAGNEYYEAGKFSEASAMYGRGLEHIPANTFLIYKRATSRIRMGQWERAVDDLNAVLKINPGHYEALQQRAQAFAKLGRCHGKMLREITRF